MMVYMYTTGKKKFLTVSITQLKAMGIAVQEILLFYYHNIIGIIIIVRTNRA